MRAGKRGGVVLPKAESRQSRCVYTQHQRRQNLGCSGALIRSTSTMEIPRSTGAAEDCPYHAGVSHPAKRIWEHPLRLWLPGGPLTRDLLDQSADPRAYRGFGGTLAHGGHLASGPGCWRQLDRFQQRSGYRWGCGTGASKVAHQASLGEVTADKASVRFIWQIRVCGDEVRKRQPSRSANLSRSGS